MMQIFLDFFADLTCAAFCKIKVFHEGGAAVVVFVRGGDVFGSLFAGSVFAGSVASGVK